MSEERWIEISLDSYEMGRKLRDGIALSYKMHQWAMDVLRRHWIEKMQVLTVNEMQPMMTYWLRENGEEAVLQRFSLDIALSRTILYFNNNLQAVSVEEGSHNSQDIVVQVSLPNDVVCADWNKIDIQARQVWKRYLEDHGRLTTHYGTVFLEGDWTDQMRGYAKDLGVTLDILPHIWNSITLREIVLPKQSEGEEMWLMRFNFFSPNSVAAKKRTKKGRMYVEE